MNQAEGSTPITEIGMCCSTPGGGVGEIRIEIIWLPSGSDDPTGLFIPFVLHAFSVDRVDGAIGIDFDEDLSLKLLRPAIDLPELPPDRWPQPHRDVLIVQDMPAVFEHGVEYRMRVYPVGIKGIKTF